MELFEFSGEHVYPSIHALMIEPFKSMWENDTSDKHEACLKDFRYIELMCSPKKSNPYYGYTDVDVREKRVKEAIYKDENYGTTTDMLLGVMKYKELLENSLVSYGLFIDAVSGAEKLRDWLRAFDLAERTPHGAMVLKPRDVTSALKDIPELMKKLELSRTNLVAELREASKTRSDRETGFFER
jgi:hypothetical protein